MPCECDVCAALFENLPYGTMVGGEDGVCREIPPPTGEGPWVLYWHPNLNQNWPYWEAVANLGASVPPLPMQEVMRKTKPKRKPKRKR